MIETDKSLLEWHKSRPLLDKDDESYMDYSDPNYLGYMDMYEASVSKSTEELRSINSRLAEDYYDSHAIFYPLIEKGYSMDYLLDLPVSEFALLQMRIIEVEKERLEAMKKK